jgi:hypothetical protein
VGLAQKSLILSIAGGLGIFDPKLQSRLNSILVAARSNGCQLSEKREFTCWNLAPDESRFYALDASDPAL